MVYICRGLGIQLLMFEYLSGSTGLLEGVRGKMMISSVYVMWVWRRECST